MSSYKATVETHWSQATTFAYLSDFSTSEEWDPGVIRATKVGDPAIREGAEFHLVARFLGREAPITYKVVEYNPPDAVTFRGENATVVSLDRITFDAIGEGTRVTYEADLQLKGPMRLADPLLAVAFKRVGDRALAGLGRVLAGPEPVKAAP
jgi:carbon monoxide dehydrogenase subunit G